MQSIGGVLRSQGRLERALLKILGMAVKKGGVSRALTARRQKVISPPSLNIVVSTNTRPNFRNSGLWGGFSCCIVANVTNHALAIWTYYEILTRYRRHLA